jgi:hypothetical protein
VRASASCLSLLGAAQGTGGMLRKCGGGRLRQGVLAPRGGGQYWEQTSRWNTKCQVQEVSRCQHKLKGQIGGEGSVATAVRCLWASEH